MAQLKDLLVNGTARIIGSLYADLSGNVLNYGYCMTDADVQEKVVNTTGSFNLIDGSKILVLFKNSNTASSPTLNVNNTGAKNIYVDDSNGIPNNFIVGQQYYWFVYNATNNHWRVAGGGTTQITAIEYGGTNNNSFTANKPLFFNGTKIIGSTDNYINDTSLAINKTSITSGYKFEVNGKSLFDDNIYLAEQKGIYKYVNTAETTPMIQLNSNNLDVSILKIDGDNPTTYKDSQSYGYNLKYIGTGSAEQHRLDLIADNMGGTDVTAISVTNSGQVAIGDIGNKNYRLYVNGDTYFLNGKSYFGLGNDDQKYYIDTANNNTTSGNAELRDVNVHTLGIRQAGAGEGISLFGGYTNVGFANFGIAHAETGDGGKYGDVQSQWATYFTIKRESNPQRGWIWRGDNAASIETMAASLSNRGVFTTRAIAADNTYIAFPEGGVFTYEKITNNDPEDATGMLVIELPQQITNTMVRFDVEIYTAFGSKRNLITYHIGGCNDGSSNIWTNTQAYSEGIGNLSNLTVRFGQDESNNIYVTIGESNTVWNYPKIAITNLIIGHNNATVEKWSYGWKLSIKTVNPCSSISNIIISPKIQSSYTNMNLFIGSQYMDMDAWSGDNYTGDLPYTYCRGKTIFIGPNIASSDLNIKNTVAFTPEPNTWYTLSFYAKADILVKLYSYLGSIDQAFNNDTDTADDVSVGKISNQLSTSWKKYWITFKTTATSPQVEKFITILRLPASQVNTNIFVCLPKLEKGIIPSDWSRNPGDVVHLFGSSNDSSYLYSGGGYNAQYNNLILHGDPNSGVSGIAFTSQKGNTSIDAPSDRAFIQYHAMGVTPKVENTELTEGSSGEAGRFIIGVGNDVADEVWLQAPGDLGIKHQIGANSYTIVDTNNTSWANAWTNGTIEGPVLDLNLAGIIKTTPAIPKASASISGIVTIDAQTFGGDKTFTGSLLAANNSSKDIGAAASTWRNVYATTYFGSLKYSLTLERNSENPVSFSNSANVSYNVGSVVQDFAGTESGNVSIQNADLLGGYYTRAILDNNFTNINADISNINTQITNINNLTTQVNTNTTNITNLTTQANTNTNNINTIKNTNLHVSNDTDIVVRSSTTYCSTYNSGHISYIVKNGICYISLNNVTFTDQVANTNKDHTITGFPKVKNNFISFASMNGGNLVGEVFAYAGYTHIIIRSKTTSGLYGTMSYIVNYS